jgi:hypothetical protein
MAGAVAIAGRLFLVFGITGLLLWPVNTRLFSDRWRSQFNIVFGLTVVIPPTVAARPNVSPRTPASSGSFSIGSVALTPLAADAQSIFNVCELVHNHLRSSDTEYGSRRAQAMTQRPANRIPEWLTIDLLLIVVSLAIIGIYIAID